MHAIRTVCLSALLYIPITACNVREVDEPTIEPASMRADVGPLPAPEGAVSWEAFDINNAGMIVGTIRLRGSNDRIVPAAWLPDGTPIVLSQESGIALGINEAGAIIGQVGQRSVYWSTTFEMHELGVDGRAIDINNRGDVLIHGSNGRTFLWRKGALLDLGELGQAAQLNGSGAIVGVLNGSARSVFVRHPNGRIDVIDLPSAVMQAAFPFPRPFNVLINDDGLVVIGAEGGTLGPDGTELPNRIWTWTKETGLKISYEGGRGPLLLAGVNNAGLVVGARFPTGAGQPTLWDLTTGEMSLLPRFGIDNVPTSLNEGGTIVGLILTPFIPPHRALIFQR